MNRPRFCHQGLPWLQGDSRDSSVNTTPIPASQGRTCHSVTNTCPRASRASFIYRLTRTLVICWAIWLKVVTTALVVVSMKYLVLSVAQ